jgi:hypothetical protein
MVFIGVVASADAETRQAEQARSLNQVLQLAMAYKGRVATVFVNVPLRTNSGGKRGSVGKKLHSSPYVRRMLMDFGIGGSSAEKKPDATFPRVCVASSLHPDARRYDYGGGVGERNYTVREFVGSVLDYEDGIVPLDYEDEFSYGGTVATGKPSSSDREGIAVDREGSAVARTDLGIAPYQMSMPMHSAYHHWDAHGAGDWAHLPSCSS